MVETDEARGIIKAIKRSGICDLCGEVVILQGNKQMCFWVNIQPIIGVNQEVYGKMISFTDVSDYKELLGQLHEKNLELETKNKMLEEYALTIEELAIAKERNRVARDVHDTLGQTMTVLVTLLQLCKMNCRVDPAKTEAQLTEAVKMAGEGLKEIRRSVSGLTSEKIQGEDLISMLNSLFNDFQSSGMKINFNVKGAEKFDSPAYYEVIYRICQEGLTNSLRHGKAENVKITLQFENKEIMLSLLNDGVGSKEINKGFGLVGMEQRVRDLKGKISYGSEGEKGFYIEVKIPVKGYADINQVDLDNNPGKNI